MVAGLIGLWARRFLVDRVRYISTPSDHLILVLLIGIGLTGMGMTFVAHTDIVSLKMFMLGLMRFEINPLPQDPILMAHLAMVATLMIIFPISKLLHAPGVFFSPSRNQVDDPREHRHVAPWAAELEISFRLGDQERGRTDFRNTKTARRHRNPADPQDQAGRDARHSVLHRRRQDPGTAGFPG
jgi:hypothetical protein